MSADNWAICPRCKDRRAAEVAHLRKCADDGYGVVSADEYRKLTEDAAKLEAKPMDHNFREDYEIYGADDGTVIARYGGGCSTCDLTVAFEYEHPFYPEATET